MPNSIFPADQTPARRAAQSQAHGQRGEQGADVLLLDAEFHRRQSIDVHLGHGGQEPVKGAGHGRQEQGAVGGQRGEVARRFAPRR